MKISDILGMSLSNLWRRKTRAVLTILGVIIGTASIVVMLSLGIGLKSSMLEQVGSAGGLTQISVYMDYYGDSSDSQPLLDDETISSFMEIDHVDRVDPILEFDMPIKVGIYESYAMLYGVGQEYLNEIPVGEGELPNGSGDKLQLIAGNHVTEDFMNSATGDYPYWDTQELPDVDLLNTNIVGGITVYEEENQADSDEEDNTDGESIFPSDGSTEDYEEPEVIASDNLLEDSEDFDWENDEDISYSNFGNDTKRVPVSVVGIVEGGEQAYNEYSYYYYADVDQLKKFLKENFPQNAVIPGQPTDRNGKPYKDLKYSNAIVNVDQSDNVEDVLQTIQDMGFRAEANKEWLEEIEKEFMIIEAVLGGIGSVAMLVAAISIANTMTMSTYERTKEIGVMKVLGCKLSNIRAMFLSEAAFIGFFGGVIGIGLSELLSIAVNKVAPAVMGGELDMADSMRISVIPIWLILAALLFSTLIGMLAGFFPAQRATKLSPLAAIRNE